jgi:hypothetical protein
MQSRLATSGRSTGPRSPFAVAADLLDPPVPLHDTRAYITDVLGEFLWSKQREVCEALDAHRRVAVHSCHDAGKSFLASRVVCSHLGRHPPGEAFAVTSAPTFAQVRGILWREIQRAFKKADGALPGRVNQTEWLLGNELIGFGRKPADQDPTAFQGIHARWVLVVLDEAGGIPKALWDAASTLTTNEDSRILAIGNPDDPASHFAEVCKPGSGWHVIHIGAEDTPAFTGELVPDWLLPMLVSPTWVAEKAHEWGEQSPLYLSKVRGVFPEDADDGVVPASAAARCRIAREELPAADLVPVELGVDVGAGGDQTVVRERRGVRAARVWRNRSRRSEEVVGLVMQAIAETGATRVKVDVIGWGWGVVGHLRSLRSEGHHKAVIVPVNVGEASTRPKRFPRLRDQLWWEVGRELSMTGGWDLSEVDDGTVAQLLAPKYALDASGRVKVEPKDETRERLGRSPDDADALLLAYHTGSGRGAAFEEAWRQMAAARTTTTDGHAA